MVSGFTFAFGFVVVAIALIFVAYNYSKIKAMPEVPTVMELKEAAKNMEAAGEKVGEDFWKIPERMSKMAKTIREGSWTFMKEEYKIIVIVVGIMTLFYTLIVERFAGLALAFGTLMGTCGCLLSMSASTHTNVRSALMAFLTKSSNKTLRVMARGGSISGICICAFGGLGLLILLFLQRQIDPLALGGGLVVVFPNTRAVITQITSYSLGCSIVAIFNRVGGGNFTKAADIGADKVGKIDYDLEEDDGKNPCTAADNVGDNVNDTAGNGSDLMESGVAAIVAGITTPVVTYLVTGLAPIETVRAMVDYCILLFFVGVLGTVIGVAFMLWHKETKVAAHELDIMNYCTYGAIVLGGLILAKVIFAGIELPGEFRYGWMSAWIASVLGNICAVLVALCTEYFTSGSYKPTQRLANDAKSGEAAVASEMIAIGMKACLPICLCIGAAIVGCYFLGGIVGVSIGAVSVLASAAATVSADAFGPIADNAGGIAESCKLPAFVRSITDEHDATGNTKAAVGKGAAIEGAAFATISLMMTTIHGYQTGTPVLNVANTVVFVGTMIGASVIAYFLAIIIHDTNDSAEKMAARAIEQFKKFPGILLGTQDPDHIDLIRLGTIEAMKKMAKPSLIAVVVPMIAGILLGPEFAVAVNFGMIIMAVPMAIFLGVAGGAADNAKKLIEVGFLGPEFAKHSDAHKASICGDTIGDIFKDCGGPDMDVVAKISTTTCNTMMPMFMSLQLIHI